MMGEDKTIRLVVFKLGDEEFGVPIEQVEKIIRAKAVTAIPDSPGFIAGVTNVAGEIAVVIDLMKLLALKINQGKAKRYIIMRKQHNSLFGLLVDEVSEVLLVAVTDIKPAPKLVAKIDHASLTGVVTLGSRLIILLDLDVILSEDDLIKLSVVHSHHLKINKASIEGTKNVKENFNS